MAVPTAIPARAHIFQLIDLFLEFAISPPSFAARQPRPRGIEIDVIRHDPEIIPIRVTAVDRHRLVAALKHMPLRD
jgi:hypothetical protein